MNDLGATAGSVRHGTVAPQWDAPRPCLQGVKHCRSHPASGSQILVRSTAVPGHAGDRQPQWHFVPTVLSQCNMMMAPSSLAGVVGCARTRLAARRSKASFRALDEAL